MNSAGLLSTVWPPSVFMRSMRDKVYERLLWAKKEGYPETP